MRVATGAPPSFGGRAFDLLVLDLSRPLLDRDNDLRSRATEALEIKVLDPGLKFGGTTFVVLLTSRIGLASGSPSVASCVPTRWCQRALDAPPSRPISMTSRPFSSTNSFHLS